MKLSIVIPAYNEEENIAEVIKRIESTLGIGHELIIVNDHSSDSTRGIVLNLSRDFPNIRLIDNPAAPGFANAIKAGLTNISTEVVVPVMGDLCDDLETIKVMLRKIEEGYDVVCGSRYIKGGARLGGSRIKDFFSRWGGRSLGYLLDFPTSDIANAFKMYRKKVIDSVNIESSGFEVSMEITLKAYYLGFRITEVPTVWKERTKGQSSFKVFRLLPRYIRLYIWALRKRVFG